LTHASRLLPRSPALALAQAEEILRAVPNHPQALLLQATAHRALGNEAAALRILEPLARQQPRSAATQYELALTLLARGLAPDTAAAQAALQRAVDLKPDFADAWRALGDLLTLTGDAAGAGIAYARQLKASTRDPRLLRAAAALCANEIPTAETLLRAHLQQHPTDIAAIRMLAEVAARLRRFGDAEKLLTRCLELAPGFTAARHNLAIVLLRRNEPAAALREIDRLQSTEPNNPNYVNLKAAILARIGEFDRSLELYAEVLAMYPETPKVWLSYGHALASAGREADSIAAYRRSIALRPAVGEAWWSLANLKTFRFAPEDLAALRAGLERTDLTAEDRLHFHFALGKALEDAAQYADSFAQYVAGNDLRRSQVFYSADETTQHLQRSRSVLTADFFASRAGFGSAAPDPIFIVGLPRSGSTLLEQILASHSQVEGTMELPDLISMVRTLGGRKTLAEASRYPEVLADLTAADCAALGQQYLERTRIQRRTGRPFFIDKMPNNFAHIGFIHLILPNARIIDARRHPLGCCFSGYKQHFARGQAFSYGLEDLGRYYRDYVALLAHFDAVLPGRVHRVFYERMVEDTADEVRRLLEYCGLPFEEACLRFYENERPVRTASAQQVRQPIFRGGMEQWRHYEPWLEPLKLALGDVLTAYPAVPDFAIA